MKLHQKRAFMTIYEFRMKIEVEMMTQVLLRQCLRFQNTHFNEQQTMMVKN